MDSDAEGHVLGNFHAYYSFNPVHERLRFMNLPIANALRRALLVQKSTDGKSKATSSVLDVGCNEGDLTIGLYDALNGRAELASSVSINDVASFDLSNISVLNERMQRDKKQIDDMLMGQGEGVSKKVAKAKAAKVALRALGQSDDQKVGPQKEKPVIQVEALSLTEEELATRKSLMVLGVDIDEVLITRAAKKPVQLTKGDAVHFCHVDVMSNKFSKTIASFTEMAHRSTEMRTFDLVTCFSVTMWIHLNNGDEGLWKFLETVSDMTEHLLIEPQTWKCYRNAQKRLTRMRVKIPQSFYDIKVRSDVLEKIDSFLLAAGRFRYKGQLGKTNWSRNLILYSRKFVPGISSIF